MGELRKHRRDVSPYLLRPRRSIQEVLSQRKRLVAVVVNDRTALPRQPAAALVPADTGRRPRD